jgi:nucleotide-binding universal stress UspA family protein
MTGTILVPLDGSPLSESALPYAVGLASDGGARLVLARIVAGAKHEEQVSRESSQTLNDTRRYLERVGADLRSQTLSVEIVARGGDPNTELLDLSETLSADLIVMGTHGRSGFGRWIYGSVADELLRHATTPVMLVPGGTLRPWPAQRPPKLLVTLDGSPLSEAILRPIPQLAALRGQRWFSFKSSNGHHPRRWCTTVGITTWTRGRTST